MIADFEDFVTWMFVTIDDLWQQIAPLYQRPGPNPTTCSDSEVITIALVSERLSNIPTVTEGVILHRTFIAF